MEDRIQAIKNYLELSLNREKELHDLVFLASEICQTPIAAISLIDDVKQYPVVEVGSMMETSCDIAFCNHTIKEKDIFEVTDATQDCRFIDNPLVTGSPYIRFYAGIPLTTTRGLTIGALCVIDHQPKKLTERQIKSLQILSKQILHRLELLQNLQLLQAGIQETEYNKELLEQAEVMKKAFYDGCDDFFLLLNPKLEIVSFNAATDNLFKSVGKSIEKGERILEYLQPANAALFETIFQKAQKGEMSSFELLGNANTLNQRWFKFSVSPTYNNRMDLIGIACIGCDIDKEKTQQAKLNLQSSTLFKIAELHSHQIRHPLTNILAMINIIKQDNFTVSEQFLEFLEKASKELDEAIRNIVLDSVEAASMC